MIKVTLVLFLNLISSCMLSRITSILSFYNLFCEIHMQILPFSLIVLVSILVISIYINDMVVPGNYLSFFYSLIKKLAIQFTIHDLGQLHHFLGVGVLKHKSGLV